MNYREELTKLIAGCSEFQAKVLFAFVKRYLSKQVAYMDRIEKLVETKKQEIAESKMMQIISKEIKKIVEENSKEQGLFVGKLINIAETMYLRGYKDSLVDIFEELQKKQEITMNYKREIIEILNNIEDVKFLEFIYRFTKRLKGNWGL